jgi:hypothetical protein
MSLTPDTAPPLTMATENVELWPGKTDEGEAEMPVALITYPVCA